METILALFIGYFSGTLTAFGIVLWQMRKIEYPKWTTIPKCKNKKCGR